MLERKASGRQPTSLEVKSMLQIPQALSDINLTDFIRRLGPWKRVLYSLVALFSLCAAHYAGFIFELPAGLRPIVADRFAPAYFSVFALHAVTSIALARLAVFVLMPLFVLASALLIRLLTFKKIRYAKRYIQLRRYFDASTIALTVLLAIAILLSTYIRSESLVVLAVAAAFILLLPLLSSFNAPLLRPHSIVAKMGAPRNPTAKWRLLPVLISLAITSCVVLSFIVGGLRFEKLEYSGVVQLATSCMNVYGTIIISSGDEFLMRAGDGVRYYVVGRDFAVVAGPDVESVKGWQCEFNTKK